GVVVHHDPVAKHRTSSTSGQGRRSRGSSSQQQSSQQSAPAQSPAGSGTHSITEGAKSALAVIAASTIVPATSENPADAADVPVVPAPAAAAAERPKKSRRKRGSERKGPRSEAEQLLDSVLDALPEPKAPGHGRNRRRVTTAMLTASPAAISDASDPVAGSDPQP